MKNKLLITVLPVFCVIVCALAFTACASGAGHKHSYSSQWSSDATYHWHECANDGCPQKQNDKANHTDTDGDGKCDECKYVMGNGNQDGSGNESGGESGSGNENGNQGGEEKEPDRMVGKTFKYSRWECPDPELFESTRLIYESMTFEFTGDYQISVEQSTFGRTLKGTYSQSGNIFTLNFTHYVSSSDGQTYEGVTTLICTYENDELKISRKLDSGDNDFINIYYALEA